MEYWPTFLRAVNSGSYSEDAWQAFRNISQSPVLLKCLLYLYTDGVYHDCDPMVFGTEVEYKPSPLQVATYFGFEEIVQRLLGTRDTEFYFDGKVYKSVTFHNVSEALFIAAHRGYKYFVRLLLDYGANVNYRRCESQLSYQEPVHIHTAL